MPITQEMLLDLDLVDAAVTHALSTTGNTYDNECVIRCSGNRQIRSPAHPDGCNYIRVTAEIKGGVAETGYWTADEWREDPCTVMGAILGAANAPSTSAAAYQTGTNHSNLSETDLAEAGLDAFEIIHAVENTETDYGDEAIIVCDNNRQIRCPVYPDDCDYVRITTMINQQTVEIAYWHETEWQRDPSLVMGAIISTAHNAKSNACNA